MPVSARSAYARSMSKSHSTASEPRKLPFQKDPRRQKALLMGYYGVGNLGDEMMLVCLQEWLERQGFELTVLSERPATVSNSYGLPAVENAPLLGEWAWRRSWFQGGAWRVLRALAASDVLIVGGGDLIRDHLGWRTFFFTIEKLVAAILMGKKVCLVNSGIGQPSTRYGRIILKWVLQRCQRIIVRDARSENVCRELGVTEQVSLAPDIALALPEILVEQKPAPGQSRNINPYVLVCLRHNPNAFQTYELTEQRIRTLARSLDDLIERHNVDIVFLPMHATSPNGRGDALLHGQVARAMAHGERVHLRTWIPDLTEVCGWIRDARLVVAMRLHAAVLAYSFGRPCVLMPYDRKVREFGDLMSIRHSIEAAALDNIARVGEVLDSAWGDERSEADADQMRHLVFSIWADLTLAPCS
jgi:polysaccharide pyruvyl transferase CsaB